MNGNTTLADFAVIDTGIRLQETNNEQLHAMQLAVKCWDRLSTGERRCTAAVNNASTVAARKGTKGQRLLDGRLRHAPVWVGRQEDRQLPSEQDALIALSSAERARDRPYRGRLRP
jgi:hypothetical protein